MSAKVVLGAIVGGILAGILLGVLTGRLWSVMSEPYGEHARNFLYGVRAIIIIGGAAVTPVVIIWYSERR